MKKVQEMQAQKMQLKMLFGGFAKLEDGEMRREKREERREKKQSSGRGRASGSLVPEGQTETIDSRGQVPMLVHGRKSLEVKTFAREGRNDEEQEAR